MFKLLALVTLSQEPSSQQIYDSLRTLMDKADAVRFETNRVMSDAWENEMGVTLRRPKVFNIAGIGLRMESDGEWLFETGNAGSYLRKLKPGETLVNYPGFESFHAPNNHPKVEGKATETSVSWKPNDKVWRVSLRYPGSKAPVHLLVDASTMLPVGYSLSTHFTFYYKNVKLHHNLTSPLPSLAPPSLKKLLEQRDKALAGCVRIKFSLVRDNSATKEDFEITLRGKYLYTARDPAGKVVKRTSQASGKKIWQMRELFGFEGFTSKEIKVRYVGQPEFALFDPRRCVPSWRVKSSVPGSSKAIYTYFDYDTWLPMGYELVVKGDVIRTVAYEGLTLSPGH